MAFGDDEDGLSDAGAESDDDGLRVTRDDRKVVTNGTSTTANGVGKRGLKSDEAGVVPGAGRAFEEVPMDADISSDSDTRAEILAMGHKMIKKAGRSALVDDAYNRYAFNDTDLPEWFAEDENKHNKKMLPITKEEVDTFKLQLKAINARPMHKIAEAKARKKFKAVKRWEKLKGEANAVAENSSMKPMEKIRAIEKIYSKRSEKKKVKDRVYVVAKKSGGRSQSQARGSANAGKGQRVKVVDHRMKKDKRGAKASERKTKKRRFK